VQEDARAEPLGPGDHAGVVVRVRDGDRLQAPGRAHRLLGRVVDQRHAVPEQAAGEQRALPDGERRLGADPGQPGLDLLDAVGVVDGETVDRRPLLSGVPDVLALVEAYRALAGRRGGGRELGSAGHADVRGVGHPRILTRAAWCD
jgi:hypothetical protein